MAGGIRGFDVAKVIASLKRQAAAGQEFAQAKLNVVDGWEQEGRTHNWLSQGDMEDLDAEAMRLAGGPADDLGAKFPVPYSMEYSEEKGFKLFGKGWRETSG